MRPLNVVDSLCFCFSGTKSAFSLNRLVSATAWHQSECQNVMYNSVASPRSGGRADRAAGQPVCLSPTGPSSATGRQQAGRGVIWSTRSVHFAFHLSIDACGDRPQPVLSLVSIITQTQNANARASTQAIRKTQENYASQKKKTRNKSIVPCWTMHTGRMSCHSTKKGVNY